MKAIKKDKTGSVLIQHKDIEVWVDVWYDSVDGYVAEWNKYIFYTNCEKDMQIKDFQESSDNFEEASDIAIEYYINN
jgi:hypothetical protein